MQTRGRLALTRVPNPNELGKTGVHRHPLAMGEGQRRSRFSRRDWVWHRRLHSELIRSATLRSRTTGNRQQSSARRATKRQLGQECGELRTVAQEFVDPACAKTTVGCRGADRRRRQQRTVATRLAQASALEVSLHQRFDLVVLGHVRHGVAGCPYLVHVLATDEHRRTCQNAKRRRSSEESSRAEVRSQTHLWRPSPRLTVAARLVGCRAKLTREVGNIIISHV